ncbi:chromodomain protein [Colletotrichum sojae]|uniref:Chromodomain protein n=1 Tax=Colletotrichum sojae TaxID=2175907 RepID=A0A8H6IN66_9PEZI|nr:chromodomain protein [Colletotrichum sojae]
MELPRLLSSRASSSVSVPASTPQSSRNPRRNITPRNHVVPSSPSPSPSLQPSRFVYLTSATTPLRPGALRSDYGVDQGAESQSTAPSSPPSMSPDLSTAKSSIIRSPMCAPAQLLKLPRRDGLKRKRTTAPVGGSSTRKSLRRNKNADPDRTHDARDCDTHRIKPSAGSKWKGQTESISLQLADDAVADAPEDVAATTASPDQSRPRDEDDTEGGDDEEQYPVDCILDHHLEGVDGDVKLLVRWGGKWNDYEPTWEDEESLWDTCRSVVFKYWHQKGRKNRRTKMLSLDPHDGPFTAHRILKARPARRRRDGSLTVEGGSRLEYLVEYVGYARPEWQPESCLPAAFVEEWDRTSAFSQS